jgi:hypothetical protein
VEDHSALISLYRQFHRWKDAARQHDRMSKAVALGEWDSPG